MRWARPHGWKRREMDTVFWLKNQKGRGHSEEPGVDGKILLELFIGKKGGKLWNGFIWLRLWTGGGFK
jgi:hypothetical protein